MEKKCYYYFSFIVGTYHTIKNELWLTKSDTEGVQRATGW